MRYPGHTLAPSTPPPPSDSATPLQGPASMTPFSPVLPLSAGTTGHVPSHSDPLDGSDLPAVILLCRVILTRPQLNTRLWLLPPTPEPGKSYSLGPCLCRPCEAAFDTAQTFAWD